jgi:hypothetical protein
MGKTLSQPAFYISDGKLMVNTALMLGETKPISIYLYNTVTKRIFRKVNVVPFIAVMPEFPPKFLKDPEDFEI